MTRATEYKGYALCGHAIQMQAENPEAAQFGAGGTVMKCGMVLETSGILDLAGTKEDAWHIGLEWARAWVDVREYGIVEPTEKKGRCSG
ncbi:hypothetical protein [Burkholderia ambifaria]|uniref:hypothetical protein n=1 Tax=Burkholderia ambifaria TaxID=152480 RepID=UPI000F80D184|nr:hypothetical protein [Burkholderia ambifaria]